MKLIKELSDEEITEQWKEICNTPVLREVRPFDYIALVRACFEAAWIKQQVEQ